jgi:hypothetical protein
MPARDRRERIQSALGSFGAGNLPNNLRTAGRLFFNALGYSSEKRIDLAPNSSASFLDQFDPERKLDAEKALVGDWKAVDFLFQLSDEDVGNHVPFASGRVDNSIIESYIFLAIELAEPTYTRSAFPCR